MSATETDREPSRGRRFLRRVGFFLLSLIVLFGIALGAVYGITERRFARRFTIDPQPLEVPPPTDTLAITNGRRLAQSRGCMDCHGAEGRGRVFIDEMPVLRVVPGNITPGGPTAEYTNDDWARAVRHGVRPDGSAILFMPCDDYRYIDDRDLGAIVAYLRTLPASTHDAGETRVGPMGRVLYLAGKLPLVKAELIDHDVPAPPAPPVGRTAEYGEYLTHMCVGCHGPTLSGGLIPGAPPEWPPARNITPDRATGIARMTEAQFLTVMRTGRRANGAQIDPTHMPWRQLALMTDDELVAMYTYLRTVPAKPAGGR
jgi:mono/diheme cytochrome c family protein